jgi:hypothetical protein
MHYIYSTMGPIRNPQKACRDKLRQTCVFASSGICGSCSAFRCVRGAKHRHTSFHGRVGSVRFPKKALGHVTPNLCFCIQWDLQVTYWILVCPGHETSTHYFSCSGGPDMVSIKSALGHVTPNFSMGFPSTASWIVSLRSQPTRGCKVGLAGHPLGLLVSVHCTMPPHVRYTPGVILILVEFQISL